MLRGHCPGCGRDDVPLLEPVSPTRAWRRKVHATHGDLQVPGAVRCRYPVALTPDETPEEP